MRSNDNCSIVSKHPLQGGASQIKAVGFKAPKDPGPSSGLLVKNSIK